MRGGSGCLPGLLQPCSDLETSWPCPCLQPWPGVLCCCHEQHRCELTYLESGPPSLPQFGPVGWGPRKWKLTCPDSSSGQTRARAGDGVGGGGRGHVWMEEPRRCLISLSSVTWVSVVCLSCINHSPIIDLLSTI